MTANSPISPSAAAGEPNRSAPAAPPGAALPIILAGVFMPALDFFITNVAIPSMQKSLHAGPAAIQFFIAAYGLTYAAGMISGGRLGDLFGRRRIFSIGMVAFTVFSLLCAMSQTSGELIAARALQGFAAALMTPQVMGMINTMFDGPGRIKAYQAYGLAGGLAGAFGQLIGGGLISLDIAHLGWRTIFLINVPIGLIALAATPRLLPESYGERGRRLDVPGVLLIGAAMAAMVLPLTVGREERWPLWSWCCLVATVPLLVLFARYQAALSRRENGSPLIEVAMFRNRTFTTGVAMTAVQFLAMGAFWLLQAIYLQQGRGFSAIGAGIETLVVGLGFFFSAGAAPKLAEQMHGKVLALGGLVLAVGYGLIALATAHVGVGGTVAWLYPGMLLAGFGMGLVVAPLSSMTLATVGPRYAAAAAGVLSTSQEVGGAFGVAFVGLVFFRLVGPAESLGSFPVAIEWSLALLAVFGLVVTALSRLMPQGPATVPAGAEAAAEANAPA